MCSESPDTSGINENARKSGQLAEESLNWFKGEMARTQGQRDAATQAQIDVAQQQVATMAQQNKIAEEYDAYRKATFQPLEESIVADAQGYDTAERRESAANEAGADVQAALQGRTAAATRSLARMGYDPTATTSRDVASEALALAGAKTGARRLVENTGRALKMDAASLGRNLPSAQVAAVSAGTGAGSVASGAAGGAVNSLNSGGDLMGSGYRTALAGYGAAGDLYGQSARLSQVDNSGLWGAVGQVGGAAITAY